MAHHLVFIWASLTVLATIQAVPVTTKTIGQLKASVINNGLSLELNGHQGGLSINLGLAESGYSNSALQECDTEPSSLCFKSQDAHVKVHSAPIELADVSCYKVKWFDSKAKQEDCIDLSGASWYGGGELFFQHWPISNLSQSRVPYVTGDFYHHPNGGSIERIWYSSKGHAVMVDEETPLFLRFNQSGDGKMCFSASYEEYPYSVKFARQHKVLSYTVCTGKNIRAVLDYALNKFVQKPKGGIDLEVVAKPIWSTWAKYKAVIDQKTVLQYAKEISEHQFKASHVEVDDKWETCYGQLEFDKTKFPDPAGMVKEIRKYGFGVSFWVHPFVNLDCPAFKEGADKKYFVRQMNASNLPITTTWWNGDGGYIDFTNKEAIEWYVGRLQATQKSAGFDTYKFDAGELHWLNDNYLFSDANIMETPTLFTQKYTQTAARFGRGVEVRSAYKSQDLAIFLRMLDKDSNWGYNNGLKTLITTALLFSVQGYPFVLPDMIGGNAYGDVKLPEKELFIRWLQANVFMPALQFSYTPWDYDQETIDISKKMVELHEAYLPTFKALIDEAVKTGNPIVRPLWWNDPEDDNAFQSDSQFLLGNDILVAPVLEDGARKRDIYLPKGNWQAQMDGDTKVYKGPTWLKDYPAALSQLPFFKRT